jgi:hypothetical protein
MKSSGSLCRSISSAASHDRLRIQRRQISDEGTETIDHPATSLGPGGANRVRPNAGFFKKENLKIVALRFAQRAATSASPATI